MKSNSRELGLFPLRLFMLPGEQSTLHIYEPRYLQLVSECLTTDCSFGIPYQGKTTLSEFGSLCEIVEVSKTYETGEMDILVECKENFKINHFQGKAEDKLYPYGSITLLDYRNDAPSQDLMTVVKKYLETLLGNTIGDQLNDYYSYDRIIKSINLTDEEKFKFLGYQPSRRNSFLIGKTKFLTLLVEQEKKVVDQFYLN